MPGGMLTITFRDGRLPADPSKPRLKMRPFMRAVTAAPTSVDWYSNIADWPMFKNDAAGDCTEAMVGHNIQNTSTYGDGATVTITDDDVIAAYSRVSGYDPATGANDNGAILQDVYNDWRRNGVGGHKALAFAEVDVADLNEVKTAIHVFGAAGLGIVVDQQMMDDFNAGKDWARTGGAKLGGHAIVAVGYDAGGVWVVSWAQVVKMTWDVFRKVADEAWISVLPEWVNDTSGKDPLGVDLYGLGEAMTALTGEPNPFRPGPSPAPSPVPPGPAPVPVGPADESLAVTAHKWLKHRHEGGNAVMAKELRAWLAAKKL